MTRTRLTLRRLATALGLTRATADDQPEPPTQVVAVLVPSGAGFRLRATPDVRVPDGAGRIYRTPDGRIALDWHEAS
ncbi:hypothetical protein [Cryptosporangium arvum]|uniref:Uncharacterized protein n=1 Tax=Cryptosporangium arvum DSM 44712 TaxID=927661 RepID=A0A010Z3H3_9ACTN|nr:hypothetical protein [Cryptosporangium arvum]EXG81953.1 hypothetical protein CryarDRAFT_3078 [Cryptosporangium arvum DSM 44712]